MAIWDVIGLLAAQDDWGFTNSTYQSTLGNYVQFAMGGGYTTNILGTNSTLVIDWESILEHKFGPLTSGGGLAAGILFGIGGDAFMLLGNRSEFSYQGCDFSVSRGRTNPPMDCHYVDNQLATLGLKDMAFSIYNAPVYAVALGSLALFIGALLLQFIYKAGLSGSPASSNAEKLAAELIPLLESRWLWIVKLLEYLGATIVPLRLEGAYADMTATKDQISDIENYIKKTESALANQKNELKICESNLKSATNLSEVKMYLNRFSFLKSEIALIELSIALYSQSKSELVTNYGNQLKGLVGDKLGILSRLV